MFCIELLVFTLFMKFMGLSISEPVPLSKRQLSLIVQQHQPWKHF
jgi:hypothetical protein